MPLNLWWRHTCMCVKSVYDTRNASRYNCSREVYSISHCITGTHLNRNLVLLLQLHKLNTERNNKTIYIRTCDILQMAPRAYSCLKTLPDDWQIHIHYLASGHLHLIENMIIRTAYQYTGFLESYILYKLKVLFAGTNPRCNLRELISSLETLVNSVPVLFAVEEKLALSDYSLRTTKLM